MALESTISRESQRAPVMIMWLYWGLFIYCMLKVVFWRVNGWISEGLANCTPIWGWCWKGPFLRTLALSRSWGWGTKYKQESWTVHMPVHMSGSASLQLAGVRSQRVETESATRRLWLERLEQWGTGNLMRAIREAEPSGNEGEFAIETMLTRP